MNRTIWFTSLSRKEIFFSTDFLQPKVEGFIPTSSDASVRWCREWAAKMKYTEIPNPDPKFIPEGIELERPCS